MGFEKDQGTCTGRGFSGVDADGWLKNLHDFITSHADWSIINDRSTLPTQKTCTASVASTDIITCTAHDLKNGEVVRFQDTGNGVPSGISTSQDYWVHVHDANSFSAYYYPEDMYQDDRHDVGDFSDNFGVTRMEPYILISPSGTPSNVNDLKSMMKWGYHTEEAGYIRCQFFVSYDSANEEILGVYDGSRIESLDAAAFVYDFRANDNGLFYAQSQISGSWHGLGLDEFTPLSNYLESPDTIEGTTQGAISNGSDVVVQLTDAAEANLFTSGEWYYIYDFNYGASYPRLSVGYGECTGVGVADGLNADEIKFGTMNNDFPSGAKVSPYPLPVYSYGYEHSTPDTISWFRDGGFPYGKLPFYSRADGTTGYYCIDNQQGDIQSDYKVSRDYNAITTAAPDDKGNYTCQRPLICENKRPNDTSSLTYSTSMNRIYGEAKNLYLVDDDGLSVMTTGREIDSKEHMTIGQESSFFDGGSSNLEVLVLNEA